MTVSFSKTDIGQKRQLNQDFVFSQDEPVGKLQNLYIVADGMGGHNAGDFASKYTVETVVREIKGSVETKTFRIIGKAIRVANELLRAKAREDVKLYGMGTTIVVATVENHQVEIANVGDSRLYIIGEDGIRQITRDHSLVEEMVRMGGMNKEAARNHPDKNIITRAVGARDSVEVDFFTEELKHGDIVLMCSDGLSNMLSDEEIESIVSMNLPLEDKAQMLIDSANNNGGKDNIAVVLIDDFGK
ncbi:MAG: Stp1/IreP family PP2C-type Ser/Thr phosphatase [Lachnospiraceae bacterium]|nr:Stp1/IreP family PP2C-type Ser/Thr phosphatase [Lachnospiraceae bacterium]